MNDKLIFSDGSTLYITLESKVRIWVRILLIMLNVGLFCFPILLLVTTSKEELGKSLFGALGMSTMLFLFVTKPTLWNIFGRECMVITRDNFSYYRDFGFYRTPIKNISIENGLAVFIQNELAYTDEPYIVITFCEYLPYEEYKEILTTTIKTPEKNYKIIQNLLDEIFDIPENQHEFLLN